MQTRPLIRPSLLPLLAWCLALAASTTWAAEVRVTADLPYKTGETLDAYAKERGKLDVYAPVGVDHAPCLVWFYGGGLTEGSKNLPGTQAICRSVASEGILVVCPDYRLSPKVKFPAYIEDAAAAVAWTQQHAAEHGGNPARIFVGGHSAGGYLTSMLGTDFKYLEAVGVDGAKLAGLLPVSGQTMTHFTVRVERGLPKDHVVADEAAPINHVHHPTPPWLLLYAEHDMEMRAAENQFFVAALLQSGHRDVTSREIAGRDHGSIADGLAHPGDPARNAVLSFVQSHGHL